MRVVVSFLAAMAALFIAACGGGGASGSAAATLPLFLTDSFRDDYSHVWLTVHKVEFRESTTASFSTSFDSPTGVLINAKTLRDSSGERFGFLARGALPVGTYDAMRVTVGNEIILVPNGGTSGQVATITNPVVTVVLTAPITVPTTQPLVIDFDLANFQISGGNVTIALKQNGGNGISNASRHEKLEYKGTVSNLTSSTFRLTPVSGAAFDVAFSPSTPIYRSSSGAPAVLANGQFVEVHGYFLPGDNFLTASRIKIEDGSGSGQAEVDGAHQNVDLGANTMVLTAITNIQGFTPQGSTVNVTWSDSTVFRRSGVIVSENELNLWPFSEVKGVYNAGTNTIAATRITLEDDNNGNGFEAEAKGDISQVNLQANTAVLLNIRDIEGFTPQGTTLNVAWTSDTLFLRSGDVVTEAAMNQWPIAEVKGIYNSATNTLTASRIRLDNN